MRTTRRGLLAAGAGAALVAGCGPPEEPPPDEELLGRVLGLQVALASAYDRIGGLFGSNVAGHVRVDADQLRAVGAREPGATVAVPDGDALEGALALQRRVLAALVDAVGVLRDERRRRTAALLLTAAAQNESMVLGRLGRDRAPTAFPDGRSA